MVNIDNGKREGILNRKAHTPSCVGYLQRRKKEEEFVIALHFGFLEEKSEK